MELYSKVQNQQVQQNQSSNQTDWTCSCGSVNNGNFCGNCGKSKPIPKNASWTCFCGNLNKTKFCTNCGKTEQEAEEARRKANPFTNAKVGEFVKFGSYPQNANADIASIEWQVLVKENNKMLVISRYGLEARRFNGSSNNWKNSEIRKWFNDGFGSFYNKAFSEQEKKYINSSCLSDVGTSDKVFLLSKEEAEKYFANDNERKCKSTGYGRAHGAYVADYGYGIWWLRSPDPYNSLLVYDVVIGGALNVRHVGYDNTLVRPALWINL